MFFVMVAVGLSACGGGGTIEPATTVSGSAGDGPITGGTITVTDANGNVVTTNPVAPTSDSNARFSFTVPSGTVTPVTITVSGGTDTVTGATQDFDLKTAVSTLTANGTVTGNANPLSTLAVEQAALLGTAGKLTAANLTTATTNVLNTVGFGLASGINPISTAVTAANVASVTRANEAVAELIRRTKVAMGGTATLANAIAAVAEDATDGVVDGAVSAGVTKTQLTSAIATLILTKQAQISAELLSDNLNVTTDTGTVIAAASGANFASKLATAIATSIPTVTAAEKDITTLAPTQTFIDQAKAAIDAANSLEGTSGGNAALNALRLSFNGLVAGAAPAASVKTTILNNLNGAAGTAFGTAVTNAGTPARVTASLNAKSKVNITGAVIDGRVSGATLTLFSDKAMRTQVGTGSTDSAGAFSVTLTVATAPDPIYIKSTGGTDLDTGMPAPTMRFVGNTTGTNALASFNITPLTDDVLDRVDDGETLSTAQGSARTAFGLSSNTGTDGLYEDHSLGSNAVLKTAAFKKLTAGTTGGTLGAGSYKMFAITMDETDVKAPASTIADIAALTNPANSNFVSASISVAANGDISGSDTSGNFFTGKVIGSSMIFNIVNSATSPTHVTRVVGNIGLNGSVAGNFTDVTGIGTSPVMTKGVFVGSFIPASGVKPTGLATFLGDFYTPGATSGNMNLIARDIFTGTAVPRVHWGQTALTALNVTAGTLTMSNMALRVDAGSAAAAAQNFGFASGVYVKSSTIPTNLLAIQYSVPGGGKLYIATAVGLRRGIYFLTDATNKVTTVGEAYMSKVNSAVPNGFTAGAKHDVTIAFTHPGMPGQTRTAVLSQGMTPSIAVSGGFTLPSAVVVGNSFIDTNSSAPELMIFQGSMFVMKQDANNDFLNNQLSGGTVSDHLRLLEFFESGAMQGEEIQGGNVPGGALKMRNFPENFVGFVHNQANTVAPSFSGKLNFLARTQYASSFAGFVNAYTTGTITITAPTTTNGSATLVATQSGGTAATSTLTVVKPVTGAPGVYHMHGAITGGGYVDLVWPVGGTKALYMVSASATGTVQEVGEAYITQ